MRLHNGTFPPLIPPQIIQPILALNRYLNLQNRLVPPSSMCKNFLYFLPLNILKEKKPIKKQLLTKSLLQRFLKQYLVRPILLFKRRPLQLQSYRKLSAFPPPNLPQKPRANFSNHSKTTFRELRKVT